MSDDTTTESQVAEQANESSLPEQTIEQSADSLRTDQASGTQNEAEDTSTTSEQANNSVSEDSDSDELLQWAEKAGLDTKDPVKILKVLKDTKTKLHETTTAASELKKQVTNSGDFGDSEAVIQEARVINFYNSNPDAKNYDKEMGEIYARFQESDPDFAGHLVKHLDTLYAMAKAEKSTEEVQSARKQGKVEATQAIKKAQTASSPKVNASSSAPAPTAWNEERISQVIQEGKYEQYRDEILTWERSQY
jgi:hypothetical protein